jgi:CHAT domain-containing protein
MKPVHSKRWRLPLFGAIGIFLLFLSIAPQAVSYFSATTLANSKPEQPSSPDETQPQGNPSLPDRLWQEAESLRAEQRAESNKKAIEMYKAASDLWLSLGKLGPATRALRCVGETNQNLGDLGRALSSFNDALQLSRRAKNQTEEGTVLNGLAYTFFLQGNSNAAHNNSVAALKIARLIGDQQIEAAALSNLGESYFSYGDLSTAQKYQQQALDLWTLLGDLRGRSLSQVALGYYNANLSEPRLALELLQQGLSSAQQANYLRGQVLALNAMGNVKAKLGYKQEALDAYAIARPLAERIGDRLFLASIMGGTGSLYRRMGDNQSALEYYEQATKIFEEIGAIWGMAESKLDLGRLNSSLANNQRASECLTEALALFRKLGMRRLEAQTLGDMGVVQTADGDYEGAIRTLEQALKLNRTGQDYRHEANVLNLIGKVYEQVGKRDLALQYYQRALRVSGLAADPAGESNTLFNIAHIERDQGNLVAAEQKLESAIEIGESIRARVSSQDLRSYYFATIRQIYELYIDVLMLQHKANLKGGFATRAFAVSERARARSLLESLQEGQANVREGVDPSLLEKERSLSEKLNAKADRHMKLLAEKETAEAEKVKHEIDGLTTEYAGVRDQIRASSPRYAALTQPEPLNLQEVQQRLLDDDSILLEYALGDDRSYVWAVTRNGLATYELPSRKQIEDSARNLYSKIVAHQMVPGESVQQFSERKEKASQSMGADTAQLSKLVLGPLAGQLGNKRLLIVSDGALQYIPFTALDDPDSDRNSPEPLLRRHEIVNEPSASTLAVLLQEAKQRTAASNSVAILADPVFEVDDPRVTRASHESTPESAESLRVKQALRDIGISVDGVQIPRLLASSEEAEAIINSAPWGTGLKAVGFEANRERVLGPELTGYRVVHFATHGMINNEHPELSGIVLSLFDQDGRSQDGFLRLHDIYNLHLPADLVVLSACSTGLGKDVRGEGLISLTRGFMYAGASGVVASLWKVDDQATAHLMKLFYEGMFQKGLTPVAALREAQLAMSQQKAWHSPFYWAGFVIQGRYDEQVKGSQFSYHTPKRIAGLVLLVVALILAAILIIRRRRLRII